MPTVRLTVVIATRINAVMKMKRFSVEETLNLIYEFVRSPKVYLTTVRKFFTSSVSVRVVFCCGFALIRIRFPEIHIFMETKYTLSAFSENFRVVILLLDSVSGKRAR